MESSLVNTGFRKKLQIFPWISLREVLPHNFLVGHSRPVMINFTHWACSSAVRAGDS
jgi:hypothetical protein